ncbi:spherulation-specific family 4 protein [Mitsuaria sp. GD03876]|uniref:spherulation-specific family 4 protein n=1 Tax=Mitsuaria sp. GD03876 TaxID=2975399 RepID=UPI002448A15E|nr:spherulation-specific family 4 protein [Mitsuaria sp. GD03876]MDH0864320.1 spherulation-specific family 4 protein [Mitsuaria sp. GD03876]
MVTITAALALPMGSALAAPGGFGMLAYWDKDPSAYRGRIPSGSLVVINPADGASGLGRDQVASWKAVIASIRAQGGKVLGYVPTGHDGSANDDQLRFKAIPAELSAYATALGGVDGYFFAQAAHEGPTVDDAKACAGTLAKWEKVRGLLTEAGVGGTMVWQAGRPGANGCFVRAAHGGEHVVVQEAAYADHLASADAINGTVQTLAASMNVKTWVLVHSATQAQMQAALSASRADYFYVTSMYRNLALPWGGPVWNHVPTYWGNDDDRASERGCLRRLRAGERC